MFGSFFAYLLAPSNSCLKEFLQEQNAAADRFNPLRHQLEATTTVTGWSSQATFY